MAATAAQIAQLRRMVAEPTPTTYIDTELAGYIETYPLMDERGEQPYTWSSATPPAQVVNTSWVATYDLNAAAADIWQEKAAVWADKYDFSADGGNYKVSNAYEQAMKQVRYYRAKRATKTAQLFKWPEETSGDQFPWIANLPEPLDP